MIITAPILILLGLWLCPRLTCFIIALCALGALVS